MVCVQMAGNGGGQDMKIGELARATHTQVETIRYYEREGLLPETARTDANYRVYGDEHVDRLSFIRHCRGLDMTLDEIRTLLKFKDSPLESCSDINVLINEHIEHVAVRIKELKSLQRQLVTLRDRCTHENTVEQCGILSGLSEASGVARTRGSRRANHVSGTHVFSVKR